MKYQKPLGLLILTLVWGLASAQDINRPITNDPGLVDPPRKVGDQGYGAGGVQDSVLSGGGSSSLPGSSVGLPNPCDYDPQRCVIPDTGAPGSGGGASNSKIFGTCAFGGSGGLSQKSVAAKDGCSQYGYMLQTTKITVRAVFKVGDTDGSGGNLFNTALTDASKYRITWSGDCTGDGVTCQGNNKQVDWKGDGASWTANYEVLEIATGKAVTGHVYAIYAPCGAVVGSMSYECP